MCDLVTRRSSPNSNQLPNQTARNTPHSGEDVPLLAPSHLQTSTPVIFVVFDCSHPCVLLTVGKGQSAHRSCPALSHACRQSVKELPLGAQTATLAPVFDQDPKAYIWGIDLLCGGNWG